MLYAPVPLAPQKNGRAGSNMRENAAFWGHSPREALIDRSDASPALRAAVTHASGGGAATTGAEMGWVVVAATSIAAARHSASACRHSRPPASRWPRHRARIVFLDLVSRGRFPKNLTLDTHRSADQIKNGLVSSLCPSGSGIGFRHCS